MRIIGTGDIHMGTHYLHRLEGIDQAGLLILNGDLTNFGSTADVRQVIEVALEANPNVLAQFGNLDRPEVNTYLETTGVNLHSQARLVNEQVCLFGVGGSNPTPFNTPSEFSEEQLYAFARTGYKQAQRLIESSAAVAKNEIPLILVSHTPPYRTRVDRLLNGKPVGSTAIRSFIEDEQPDLCICGHIHEAAGKDFIGRTPVYNPGMLRNGGWLEIEIINSEFIITLHESI